MPVCDRGSARAVLSPVHSRNAHAAQSEARMAGGAAVEVSANVLSCIAPIVLDVTTRMMLFILP